MEGTVRHHVLNTVSESIDGVVHKFIDGDLLKGGVGSDVKKLKEEIAYLKTEISHLQKQIESVPERRNEFVDQERDELRIRRKWKAWIALRAKMEADEPFEEELSNFYELFACDEEVIELVNDLAKGVKVVSNESDKDKIASVCKNMLKKIVRFRRIDKRKLAEISGYVLSSHGCAKGEE
jgi:predicted RNase H-like nuclease (RuvC/YqgF family)